MQPNVPVVMHSRFPVCYTGSMRESRSWHSDHGTKRIQSAAFFCLPDDGQGDQQSDVIASVECCVSSLVFLSFLTRERDDLQDEKQALTTREASASIESRTKRWTCADSVKSVTSEKG